jgi:hypothetical protein
MIIQIRQKHGRNAENTHKVSPCGRGENAKRWSLRQREELYQLKNNDGAVVWRDSLFGATI